jgi:hypothetical protein
MHFFDDGRRSSDRQSHRIELKRQVPVRGGIHTPAHSGRRGWGRSAPTTVGLFPERRRARAEWRHRDAYAGTALLIHLVRQPPLQGELRHVRRPRRPRHGVGIDGVALPKSNPPARVVLAQHCAAHTICKHRRAVHCSRVLECEMRWPQTVRHATSETASRGGKRLRVQVGGTQVLPARTSLTVGHLLGVRNALQTVVKSTHHTVVLRQTNVLASRFSRTLNCARSLSLSLHHHLRASRPSKSVSVSAYGS